MKHTGGRWLIGLLGLVVAIVGIVLIVRGAKKTFEKYFPMASMSHGARKATETLGLVGSIARGVVVGMVGVLFLVAADPVRPEEGARCGRRAAHPSRHPGRAVAARPRSRSG